METVTVDNTLNGASVPGRSRCEILGTHVDAVDIEQALVIAAGWMAQRESRYICHVNVHALITAAQDEKFRRVLNIADLTAADGMPLVWLMRRRGFRRQTRLSGPDFMWRLCERAAREGLGVYLYGGAPQVLSRLHDQLTAAFAGLRIVGVCSPPFRPLLRAEQEEIIARINASGAHVVFVGIGCPKQERWMSRHRGRARALMVGVGAAFDYHAGVVTRAPPWMQAHGLEWLHRLCADPRRLWRRYLATNTLFVMLLARQLLRHPFSRRKSNLVARRG